MRKELKGKIKDSMKAHWRALVVLVAWLALWIVLVHAGLVQTMSSATGLTNNEVVALSWGLAAALWLLPKWRKGKIKDSMKTHWRALVVLVAWLALWIVLVHAGLVQTISSAAGLTNNEVVALSWGLAAALWLLPKWQVATLYNEQNVS